jgi:hypothetical protein
VYIATGLELALALRGMGSVTVRNYMPTNPIVDAVGCLSRCGDSRHGGASPCIAGPPATANPRTLSPFRGAARASPHLLLFPRCLNNAQTMSRVPDFYFSEKTRAETAYCSPANVRARQASDRPPQKKRNRVAVPPHCFGGKGDRGGTSHA